MRRGYHPNTAAGRPAQYWPDTSALRSLHHGLRHTSRGDTSISQEKLGIQEDLLDPPLESGADSREGLSERHQRKELARHGEVRGHNGSRS